MSVGSFGAFCGEFLSWRVFSLVKGRLEELEDAVG